MTAPSPRRTVWVMICCGDAAKKGKRRGSFRCPAVPHITLPMLLLHRRRGIRGAVKLFQRGRSRPEFGEVPAQNSPLISAICASLICIPTRAPAGSFAGFAGVLGVSPASAPAMPSMAMAVPTIIALQLVFILLFFCFVVVRALFTEAFINGAPALWLRRTQSWTLQ